MLRRFLLLSPWLSLACAKDGARTSADGFIDAYYVERDHQRALRFAAEGAKERLLAEKALVQGMPRTGAEPRVFYELVREERLPDGAQLTYSVRVDSAGTDLHKRVLVVVRKLEAEYKVVQFAEIDLPPPRSAP
ncbi:MAG: hypothetical protein HYZ28_00395 [Myxococcales bacterium]|nr:hypothetical protein [Myxococcales bacterium]